MRSLVIRSTPDWENMIGSYNEDELDEEKSFRTQI